MRVEGGKKVNVIHVGRILGQGKVSEAGLGTREWAESSGLPLATHILALTEPVVDTHFLVRPHLPSTTYYYDDCAKDRGKRLRFLRTTDTTVCSCAGHTPIERHPHVVHVG